MALNDRAHDKLSCYGIIVFNLVVLHEGPRMQPYRILSLDGGGTWALIQVIALQKIYSEHALGHEVLRDFDLVAANSGGSITAGGLISNLPLSEIRNYFCDKKKTERIFSPLPFALVPGMPFRYLFHRFVRRILPIGAKYQTKAKLRGLIQVFTSGEQVFKTPDGKKITSPDYQLWQIPDLIKESSESGGKSPHFLICGFNYNRRRAKFFRSNADSLASSSKGREQATLCEAIHASTNAPVSYFVSPAQIGDTLYWDGAIAGLNNPVLAAVTEALANGVAASRIQVLSIGTGTIALPPATKENVADDRDLLLPVHKSTLFGDVAQLSTSILDDPPDTATFISHIILSPKGLVDAAAGTMENPVVRMTPWCGPRARMQLKSGAFPRISPRRNSRRCLSSILTRRSRLKPHCWRSSPTPGSPVLCPIKPLERALITSRISATPLLKMLYRTGES